MSRESDWVDRLTKATEEVRLSTSVLAGGPRRSQTIGVGASGDRTLVADKAAEDVLLGSILHLPGTKVLSEEAGEVGDPKNKTLAVVDPLDGSSNFERGIPFYCTSIAVATGSSLKSVTLGVVRDLVTGDLYVAEKGKGATKNGARLSTSRQDDLRKAVVGVDLSRGPAGLGARLAPLLGSVKRQVHFGANALEMCYLADGRLDAFVDIRGRMRVTDFAAAQLIATESGATITDGSGAVLDPRINLDERFGFVASGNGALHSKILSLLP